MFSLSVLSHFAQSPPAGNILFASGYLPCVSLVERDIYCPEVAACQFIEISFVFWFCFFLNNYIEWPYLSLFTQFPMNRHLDCFQYFAITNNVTMNNCVNIIFVLSAMYLWGKFLGRWLLSLCSCVKYCELPLREVILFCTPRNSEHTCFSNISTSPTKCIIKLWIFFIQMGRNNILV